MKSSTTSRSRSACARIASSLSAASLRAFAIGLAACALGCSGDVIASAPDSPDRMMFEQDVYPVLLRDCAFPICHASNKRFLVVYGPGRVRLPIETDLFDAPTLDEYTLAYERARSMLRSDKPEASLLVRKPLEASAGGASHKGADSLGRNVYATKMDPGYTTILHWAQASARGVR